MKLWEANRNGLRVPVPDETFNHVKEELHNRRVPPIFHSLVSSVNPFPEADLVLSFETVEPGEAHVAGNMTYIPKVSLAG